MFGGWRVGSIGGIPLRIDFSLLIGVLLVSSGQWSSFQESYPHLGAGGSLAYALLASVLLFGSVLVHELAHAGMARARNIPVKGITLMLWGGATETRTDDRSAADEFLVTAVGPASSLVLAAAFWGLGQTHGLLPDPLAGSFRWVGAINFALGIFNFLPGFPLDGGRVLRSIIWRVTGDPAKATRIAAGVGQLFGLGLIGWGLWIVFRYENPFGLWPAAIGWMIYSGARAARQDVLRRELLTGGTAGEAMGGSPPAIPATISLTEALDTYLMGHEGEAFPVVEDGMLVGALTFEAARKVGSRDPTRPVREAMIPAGQLVLVPPEEPLPRVVERLGGRRRAFVVRDGELIGSVSHEDLFRWVRSRARSA